MLCHNAACARACGVMEPDRILRSIYFDNAEAAKNDMPDIVPCTDCEGRCREACPKQVDIKGIICSLGKKEDKKKIDYSVLKTDMCGIPMDNPFMLSSSVVASTYDMCARALDAGWGGVCFKTVCLMDIKEASPRYSAIKGHNNRFIGFKNIEQLSDNTLQENISIFRKLKENYPTKFLLVSFMGRDDKEWAYLAEELTKAGADALELNFSCPNMTEEHTGSDVGQIPRLVERYTRIVKKHTDLPVLAKLTPNVTHIEDAAEAAIRGGADGIALINTIKSLIDVDIDPTDGIVKSSIGGYSGKAVKPIALRFVAELGKDEKLNGAHISGMGGIETWKDALEFIVLGADTVQVTTAVMENGYRIIDDLKSGLALFLMEHGYKSIKEMKKATLEGVVATEKLDRVHVIYPKFIRENCLGCQRCYLSCRDGGHQAISIKDGKPVLDPKKCVGCHLCTLVCPNDAIVSSGIPVNKIT